MSLAIIIFIIAIIIISTAGWLINNWVRARHGYDLEDEWGGKTKLNNPDTEGKIELLSHENAQLRAEMGSIKDRLANVEKIIVDDAHRLSHEIESLRDIEKH